ncbi:uncharacterized protein LOC134247142 [Saccostrea cucullata]|uniref:uncharacterized protein LOC134247142 n=1 Tax=Saccostrea cuccullata TaxID=36930 RepID=UPI002ED1F794
MDSSPQSQHQFGHFGFDEIEMECDDCDFETIDFQNLDMLCSSQLEDITENLSIPAFSDLPKPETPATPLNVQKTGNRFKESTDDDVNRLFEARQTLATKKNTSWGCKLFQDWSIERRGEPVDLEAISPSQLNSLLEKFYCEARPLKDGELYHKNTLKNLRGAINRKLADLKRNIDIVKDKDFKTSNGVLHGLLKERVREGTSKSTQHKDLIEKCDMEKNSTYFKDAQLNPIILRQCVYFNIAIHFISRGQEFHHQLKLDSFSFQSDDTGAYVTLSHEIQQKNHQGGLGNVEMNTDKRMYATDTESCPVGMLQLLIEK